MIENFVKTFRNLSKIPEIKDVKFLDRSITDSNCGCKIEGSWSIRNLDSNEHTSLLSNYFLLPNQEVQRFPSTIMEKRIILRSISPCGKYSAAILQDDDICCLTITSENQQTTSINLKEQEVHGKVYSDVELSSFCWSPDSSFLAYVAEKRKPKPTTFFSKVSEKSDDGRGQKYSYVDDWGEQMIGQHQSSIIIVNIKDHQLKVLNLPKDLCGGQVVWNPDGKGLVGVAYVTLPYRLGLIYCRNRESVLFSLNFEDEFVELTLRGQHVHSPRFSSDGSKVAYIRSPMGGPHIRSAELCLMTWDDKQTRILVDYVSRPHRIETESMFSGLCGISILPLNCWTDDSKKLIFSSMQYFGYSSYVLDVDTKQIFEVPLSENVVAYDVLHDQVLLSKSACTHPSQLILFKIPNDLKELSNVDLTPISTSISIEGIPCDWQDTWTFVNSSPHPKPEFSDLPIPVIYFGPTKPFDGMIKRPLIVWVHGGPHSSFLNSFAATTSFFVKLGYSIIFPNYRGSLGQGRDGLESLPGFCGHADVDDVYKATKETLSRFEEVLDPSKVALLGGSHGGFLVTHLAAQYPEVYKVVSSRNPVIDIASMTASTDIPDWNFVESGSSYEIGQNVSEKDLVQMFKMSPINLIENVSAPTLVLLGKNDRRVPFSQGMLYHKLLLARKIPTKAYIYDDCHPLSKVEVEADSLMQTAIWFNEYLELSNDS